MNEHRCRINLFEWFFNLRGWEKVKEPLKREFIEIPRDKFNEKMDSVEKCLFSNVEAKYLQLPVIYAAFENYHFAYCAELYLLCFWRNDECGCIKSKFELLVEWTLKKLLRERGRVPVIHGKGQFGKSKFYRFSDDVVRWSHDENSPFAGDDLLKIVQIEEQMYIEPIPEFLAHAHNNHFDLTRTEDFDNALKHYLGLKLGAELMLEEYRILERKQSCFEY